LVEDQVKVEHMPLDTLVGLASASLWAAGCGLAACAAVDRHDGGRVVPEMRLTRRDGDGKVLLL